MPPTTSGSVTEPPNDRADAYAALREPNYRRFASGFVVSSAGLQMLGAAVGWELWERTGDPLQLGYAGLARALPVVVLALPAGHIIDRFDRKMVLALTQVAMGVVAAALCVASALQAPIALTYALLVLAGCARVLNGPSRATLLPAIVPDRVFGNAVTWNSGFFQLSAVIGPLVAGVLLAKFAAAWPVYLCTTITCLVFAGLALTLKPRPSQRLTGRFSLASMSAGLGHVWREKSVLGAITLDMFAVLLGGATALLPIYADEILHVGPMGYGALRAAPYIGAFAMAIVLAHRPVFRIAGPALLWSVAGFGACMIVFGISTNFALSLLVLLLAGAFDNVSVVIRHALVQLRTPDELRGRVSAVNSVFIECSNELGAFESGVVAKYFGPVFSVVSGGMGTLVVVALVALWLAPLRKLDLGDMRTPEEDEDDLRGKSPAAS
ncbi:MAG: MFS transporter [Planctomycetota bacterium]|nr:MFS transporter [Planctomycetota bacterium]